MRYRFASLQFIAAPKIGSKLLFLAFMMTATACLGGNVANAQSSGSNLEGLLQALEVLQSDGGVQRAIGAQNSGQLDSAREGAAREAGLFDEEPPRTVVRDKLSPSEIVLARRFCDGVQTSAENRSFAGVIGFSAIERDYCRRARQLLLQVGYRVFDGLIASSALLNGAIPDSYVLGIGDEVVVSFRGQVSSTDTVRVDRSGGVVLPDLDPLQAAGVPFGEFRRRLEAATQAGFIGTDVFVSLGSLGNPSVLLVGEVANPGLHQLSGMASVIDAIGVAGGITKTGSLRRVQVRRGDEVRLVDIYSLIMGYGDASDFALRDGDRVVVPLIGPTVAVGGDVKRPGIFELPVGGTEISASELLEFAGGALRVRGSLYAVLSVDETGRDLVVESVNPEQSLRDGDILLVRRRGNSTVGSVELAGHVHVPGQRGLSNAPTVASLTEYGRSFKDDAYLAVGVLGTSDPATGARRLFPVNLASVLAGKEDFRLEGGDRLTVLSGADVRYLSSRAVQNALRGTLQDEAKLSPQNVAGNVSQGSGRSSTDAGGGPADSLQSLVQQFSGSGDRTAAASDSGQQQQRQTTTALLGCRGLNRLKELISISRRDRFAHAIVPLVANVPEGLDESFFRCPEVFENTPDLLPLLLETSIALSGEVRSQGAYPVVPDTPLSVVVSLAGGLGRAADTSNIEVARASLGSLDAIRETLNVSNGLAGVTVNPGDSVRVAAQFTDREAGAVELVGEFLRPGTYSILRGERLSELMDRAGGFTGQAYPYGAIFMRERVRRAEEVALRKLARELNAAVTVAAANRGIDPSAISAFAQLTRDIANAPATGRVVIEADPAVLQVRPELDVVLQPGDQLFIPKRPNSVLVTGDVLNPGAMQFTSGTGVESYIRQAGGFQQSADRGRLFVVLPDGRAQPVAVSPFNYSSINVPPGSTIVVPKDATPFEIFSFTKDVSTVLSQLAITAASLAVIGRN